MCVTLSISARIHGLLTSYLRALQLSKPSGSCSTTKRRRTVATTSRTSRRRHCTRADCTLGYGSPAFDQLPWISQVESAPERVDAWDIADLSLLPDAQMPHLLSDSGIGPVRRRKTSLHSLHSESSSPSAVHHPSRSHPPSLSLPLPFPVMDREGLDPRTPPPTVKFNPHEVTFLNLMPVLPSNGVDYPPSPKFPAWTRPSSPSPM